MAPAPSTRRIRHACLLNGAALLTIACSARSHEAAPDALVDASSGSYLTDARYRRAELVESLVNPANGYSALRLDHYESGATGDWSALPEWNPRVEPLTEAVLDGGRAGGALSSTATSVVIDGAARAGSEDALRALGEVAFTRYPMQLAGAASVVLQASPDAAKYGLWTDPWLGVGGLVRVELGDGTTGLAQTCSTCHGRVTDGKLLAGVPNADLDWGALTVAATPTMDPGLASNVLAWGPGRVDVTTTVGTEPCRIADLRPVRWLGWLQADATVAQRNVTSLAIRIETLIITSHEQTLRPPREIALGLAYYVRSLADALPSGSPTTSAEKRGAATFQSQCATCHVPPGLTGPPVLLATAGTDPALGESADRGTGTYRVPSLHGVASRGALFHDDRAKDLVALLDPNRLSQSYTGALHGAGPVPGHVYGLGLPDAERSDLLAYLESL